MVALFPCVTARHIPAFRMPKMNLSSMANNKLNRCFEFSVSTYFPPEMVDDY